MTVYKYTSFVINLQLIDAGFKKKLFSTQYLKTKTRIGGHLWTK